MAIGTAHLTLQNGVMIREPEFEFLIEMAGKTNRWIFFGIDDRAFTAAVVHMNASRPVTHLTAIHLSVSNTNSSMSRDPKFFLLIFVTSSASLGAYVLGPLKRKFLLKAIFAQDHVLIDCPSLGRPPGQNHENPDQKNRARNFHTFRK